MSVINSETTVIITTYNDSIEELSTALKSVINQSVRPKSILIVDDGSSNGTSTKVVSLEHEKTEIPITLLKKNNGGPSSARNYGLKNCNTKYVTFLDSDDEMLENNIEVKERSLKLLSDNYFGVYGTYLKNPGGLHKYMDFDGIANTDLTGKDQGLPGGVPSYLFRTKYLVDIEGFDDDLVHNEDFDLIIRLIRKGLKVKGSLGPGFIRNYREESVSRNDMHLETYENINRFLDKAELNAYFSNSELAKRKCANEIRLGRKLLNQAGFRKQGLIHLNRAFDYAAPASWKQYFAYIAARVGRFFI